MISDASDNHQRPAEAPPGYSRNRRADPAPPRLLRRRTRTTDGTSADRTARTDRPRAAVLVLLAILVLSGPFAALAGVPPGVAPTWALGNGNAQPSPLRFLPPILGSSAVSSGSNVYYVGAQAPTQLGSGYLTNAGAQTTVQVVTTTVTGCLSYWIGDDSAANLWGQVGYYICNGATPLAFYQIWNLTSGAALTTGTTSVSTGYHTFSMYSQSGSSTWAFALDGTVFGTYNLGASLSLGTYPVQAVSEESLVSGPWTPPEVTFSTAMQTYQTAATNPAGSGWTSVASAFEPWSGCSGNTCWGIAGNLQDATIPGDALVTGGSRTVVAAGTSLWNGVSSDFSLAASPTSVTVNAGVAGTSTLTVSPSNGFTGAVSLTASVSPSTGLACGLSPTTVSGGSGTSVLSCSGSAGTYTVTVTGTSGSLVHTAGVTFTVTDFTLSASPTSLAFVAGTSGTSMITVSSVNGFAGTVSLAAAVSPSTGLSCSLSPTSLAGSGTSTLSCSGSTAGTYSVQVTGTSGSLAHPASVSVTVTSGPVLTFSFTTLGGGTGYTAPVLTYVQGGATKTSTLTGSPTAYTVDTNSAWSVTNPLGGSSSTERWQTPQATSGTATADLTVLFGYYHQYAVTFSYSVLGGGTGYTAPSVGYQAFGAAASTATGLSVWADAGPAYTYPGTLPGSSASEAWRTNGPSGTVTGSSIPSVAYYHQFSLTFGYTVLGGGSGYTAPAVASTSFGAAVSVTLGTATWIDANAAFTYTNPLTGSGASERWFSPSPSGTASAAGSVTASFYHQVLVTFTYAVLGGGSGYTAPTVSYRSLGGAASTATGVAVWADAGAAYAFTTPLSGSTSTEAWVSAAASGTVSASGTLAAAYYHQFRVTFGYQVIGGGTGYSAPSVSYSSLGASRSSSMGVAVWADAGTPYAYPGSLPGSGTSEAWRTPSASGSVAAAGSIGAVYYHQFLVTFAYSVQGGGSGYSAPTVSTVRFGSAVSQATGASSWVDAGAAYAFGNPLGGSTSSERWMTAAATGTITMAPTISATYVHQFAVSFGYSVVNGGSGYTAPSATFQSFGTSATTATGISVWADAGAGYGLTNPLGGSTTSAAWRSASASGSITAAGAVSATYYDQYLVGFQVQVVNGGSLPATASLTCTAFGGSVSIPASGSSWVDAGGTYAFPATVTGTTGERWQSASPPSGTVSLPQTVTASYYHQDNVTFGFGVSGGGTGYGAPSLTYAALGTGTTATAGASLWADTGSPYLYAAALPGGSSTQQWVTGAPSGTVAAAGNVTVTYIHQFRVDFTYTVKGGGNGYSAPLVAFSNLSRPTSVLAATLWVWADAGSPYAYQNPLPGSTSTSSWQTNNGAGTAGSSSTYSAAYRLQFKVKFKTTSLLGTSTLESPLINVTVFGTNESLPADNVTWVDAGSSYSFPGVFYGPLPGERWITGTPASGFVLAPLNITAAYVHQYYLAIQVNAADGGTVAGSAGWYNETASQTLQATAQSGWRFEEWIGSGNGSYSGTSSTAPVRLDAPVTETAVFYVGVTLTASSGGSLQYAYGGTSGWVPAGTAQTLYVTPGTSLTVTAAPSWFYQLDGWGGASPGSGTAVVLVANAPQAVSASFGLNLYSRADSLLGIAVVLAAALGLALAVRRRRRRKKERALRMMRARARVRA